jgi:AraC-like DNA-binding protein
MSFAVPCTLNGRIVGGIIAEIPEPGEEASSGSLFLEQLKRLAAHLAEILEDSHLLSGAAMREQAARMQRERLRAEAIHEHKSEPVQQIRRIYWELEPELFLAMRHRQRREARRLLNQILMGIYSYSGEALDPTKGFVLELVTMMTRTLAEGGTEPARLLGSGFDRLRTLENIHDHETLSQWLTQVLEHLIDAAENAPESADDLRVRLIINYMREHCHEPLTRDGVARKIGLSPAHFSRLVRRALGHPFSEELQRIRLRTATRLLAQPHLSIKEIAAHCGFNDQSYFTRVFREKHGVPPQAFRKSI